MSIQNPRHIDFECSSESGVIRTGYSSLLDIELILQKMYRYCTYPVEVKQTYLRLSVRNVNYIKGFRRAIDRWCQVGTNDKLIDVNDAVLCILHLELRCTEKKLSNLWNEGFTHRREPKQVTDYTEEIEGIVNEGKIGNSTYQNQWTFPTNKAKNGVSSDFSLKGNLAKAYLKNPIGL